MSGSFLLIWCVYVCTCVQTWRCLYNEATPEREERKCSLANPDACHLPRLDPFFFSLKLDAFRVFSGSLVSLAVG